MNARNGARKRATSPALELSEAVPFDLFPPVKSRPMVASPREAAGAARVASPREGARSDAWASPRKSASHRGSGTKAGKSRLSESRAGGRKSWTIRTGGVADEVLRVRRSDAGYAVTLRYRDGSEELREPYLCYLTASEWSEARQGSLGQMARIVGEKMRRRKEAPGRVELISRLEAAAMNEPVRRNAR